MKLKWWLRDSAPVLFVATMAIILIALLFYRELSDRHEDEDIHNRCKFTGQRMLSGLVAKPVYDFECPEGYRETMTPPPQLKQGERDDQETGQSE